MGSHDAMQQLQWQQAMGADEAVDETPRSKRVKKATEQQPPVAAAAAVATSAPAPQHEKITAMPTSPSHALAEARALADAATTLEALRTAVCNFKGLSICRTATNPVFADGNPQAKLMLIGEAPGADEDEKGIPFCGASGQLLDNALSHIGLKRAEHFYITNTVFWRPPGNRKPTPEELAVCEPFVKKHIALHAPNHIVLVGGTAAASILNTQDGITKLRGKWFEYHCPISKRSIPVTAVFHPSFLLRQPMQKKTFWQDLLMIKKTLSA